MSPQHNSRATLFSEEGLYYQIDHKFSFIWARRGLSIHRELFQVHVLPQVASSLERLHGGHLKCLVGSYEVCFYAHFVRPIHYDLRFQLQPLWRVAKLFWNLLHLSPSDDPLVFAATTASFINTATSHQIPFLPGRIFAEGHINWPWF